MSYYEQKKKAFHDIDQMILDKKALKNIIFTISTRYGFGENIVLKRIEMLKDVSE